MIGTDEYFETFDEAGQLLGLAPRDEVHRNGSWHKSAQVFVFDDTGALLLQRRAQHKDLYAGLWDYSVGEHLQPGESFEAGALRGLREELGISSVALTPLGGERRVRQAGETYDDREIQRAFRCRWQGEPQADPAEVAEVRYVALDDLRAWVSRSPDAFTPWLLVDLKEFGYL